MNAQLVSIGCSWGEGATELQRATAREIVERWRPILFLHAYTIHICHVKEVCADEPLTNADCTVNDEYHELVIRIYPKFWDELTTDEERAFQLLHELCHAITAPARSLAFDALSEKYVRSSEIKAANERATDWIAKAIWHLSAAPLEYPISRLPENPP